MGGRKRHGLVGGIQQVRAGVYIGRVYLTVSRSPKFLVKQVVNPHEQEN